MTKTGSITARTLFTDDTMRQLGSRGAATLHRLGIQSPVELVEFMNHAPPVAVLEKLRSEEFVGVAVAREIWGVAQRVAKERNYMVPTYPTREPKRKSETPAQLELNGDFETQRSLHRIAQQLSELTNVVGDLAEQQLDLSRRVDYQRNATTKSDRELRVEELELEGFVREEPR